MATDALRSSRCLSERELVAVATEGEDSAESRHVDGCVACTRRVAEIGADLRLIVAALRSDGAMPAPARRARRLVWIGGSAAAAALAVVALGLGLWMSSDVPAPPAAAEQRAFLESISRSMFVAQGYDRWLQGAPATALEGGRTCGWGSLAMPCDVAWTTDDDRVGR